MHSKKVPQKEHSRRGLRYGDERYREWLAQWRGKDERYMQARHRPSCRLNASEKIESSSVILTRVL